MLGQSRREEILRSGSQPLGNTRQASRERYTRSAVSRSEIVGEVLGFFLDLHAGHPVQGLKKEERFDRHGCKQPRRISSHEVRCLVSENALELFGGEIRHDFPRNTDLCIAESNRTGHLRGESQTHGSAKTKSRAHSAKAG
jgi:hypothetical protein